MVAFMSALAILSVAVAGGIVAALVLGLWWLVWDLLKGRRK
jgi:hypothetical protein